METLLYAKSFRQRQQRFRPVTRWSWTGITQLSLAVGPIIGVWTKLDYAFDQKAVDGQGAWGILAEGVMFAWAYPEIADQMLAEQGRNETVDFSMACIPSSVEFGEIDGKRAAILHNPIFFTLSALDVPPGDKDAVGVVKEGDDSENVEQNLKQQLTGASFAVAENGLLTIDNNKGETFMSSRSLGFRGKSRNP
jgi:hypothetical protein